eukprot:COSAG02_NODE_1435_length_12610_cov_7.021181_3_plen_163_part_00
MYHSQRISWRGLASEALRGHSAGRSNERSCRINGQTKLAQHPRDLRKSTISTRTGPRRVLTQHPDTPHCESSSGQPQGLPSPHRRASGRRPSRDVVRCARRCGAAVVSGIYSGLCMFDFFILCTYLSTLLAKSPSSFQYAQTRQGAPATIRPIYGYACMYPG